MSLKEQLDLALEQLGLPRDIVGRKFIMKLDKDSGVTTGTFTSVYVDRALGAGYAKFHVRTPLAHFDDQTERLEFSCDDAGTITWEYKLYDRAKNSQNRTTKVEIL